MFTSLAAALIGLTAFSAAHADVVYWNGSSDDLWTNSANWSTQSDGTGVPVAPLNNDLIFYALPNRLTSNVVDGNLTVNSITFNNGGSGAVIVNADALHHVLTLGAGGITVANTYGVTFYTPFTLAAPQTWANNSTQPMYVNGDIDLGANTLTIAGSGYTTLAGNITGTGGITKDGSEDVDLSLSGTNTFTGPLAINRGNVDAASVASLGLGSSITLGVPGQSGFVVLRYDGPTATISKDIFAFSSTANTIRNYGGGILTLTGTIHFDGTVFALRDGTINVDGPLVGSGGGNSELRIYSSTVTLNNAHNTYDGPTRIFGGGTLLNGVNNALPTTTTLIIGSYADAGTYKLNGHNQQLSGLVLDGTMGATLVVNLTSTGAIDQLTLPSITAIGTNRTLEVDLVGGTPHFTAGQAFQIFTDPTSWLDAGNAFTSFILPSGYSWDTSQLGTNGSIMVTAVVPEPGALVLGLLALTPVTALAIRRRRKAKVQTLPSLQ